ncbi:hypothetical protein BC834DRAFT_667822 [Gloeopeniophorella convolvens]|nr:hypothetical protein BC834DRAFT_667822 [Gloeopeniophorella convolvens]
MVQPLRSLFGCLLSVGAGHQTRFHLLPRDIGARERHAESRAQRALAVVDIGIESETTGARWPSPQTYICDFLVAERSGGESMMLAAVTCGNANQHLIYQWLRQPARGCRLFRVQR